MSSTCSGCWDRSRRRWARVPAIMAKFPAGASGSTHIRRGSVCAAAQRRSTLRARTRIRVDVFHRRAGVSSPVLFVKELSQQRPAMHIGFGGRAGAQCLKKFNDRFGAA